MQQQPQQPGKANHRCYANETKSLKNHSLEESGSDRFVCLFVCSFVCGRKCFLLAACALHRFCKNVFGWILDWPCGRLTGRSELFFFSGSSEGDEEDEEEEEPKLRYRRLAGNVPELLKVPSHFALAFSFFF
jgi:hypothetical protein